MVGQVGQGNTKGTMDKAANRQDDMNENTGRQTNT